MGPRDRRGLSLPHLTLRCRLFPALPTQGPTSSLQTTAQQEEDMATRLVKALPEVSGECHPFLLWSQHPLQASHRQAFQSAECEGQACPPATVVSLETTTGHSDQEPGNLEGRVGRGQAFAASGPGVQIKAGSQLEQKRLHPSETQSWVFITETKPGICIKIIRAGV